MAEIVLRVRLIGGDHLDVTYDEPEISEETQVIEHAISTLAEESGCASDRSRKSARRALWPRGCRPRSRPAWRGPVIGGLPIVELLLATRMIRHFALIIQRD